MLLWIILGIIAVIVIAFVLIYNRIVALNRRVDQAFADIDVQLNRINELLPNLINVLKQSAVFEKKVLESIAEAHKELVSAMKSDTDTKVRAASKFFGVFYPIVYQIPQYPQLQSIKGFQDVMKEITVSIDKLAYARQFYNQAVNDYNVFIESFPGIIVAAILRKKPREFFNLPETERKEAESKLKSGELTKFEI
ncbi:MAG: LemA family protein [Candidatus Aenigmatarchaeota archaeon]